MQDESHPLFLMKHIFGYTLIVRHSRSITHEHVCSIGNAFLKGEILGMCIRQDTPAHAQVIRELHGSCGRHGLITVNSFRTLVPAQQYSMYYMTNRYRTIRSALKE